MRKNVIIAGTTLSAIAMFIAFGGIFANQYMIGALGFLLLFVGVPLNCIGLIMKGEEQTQHISQQPHISSGRHCPNCGRAIPIDARICPYCKKDFDQGGKI